MALRVASRAHEVRGLHAIVRTHGVLKPGVTLGAPSTEVPLLCIEHRMAKEDEKTWTHRADAECFCLQRTSAHLREQVRTENCLTLRTEGSLLS